MGCTQSLPFDGESRIRRSVITLESENIGDDRFPLSLPTYCLQEYTKPGATILDPFAGFGTTLMAAEALGRIGYGIEFDVQRADTARQSLAYPERMLHGDALHIEGIAIPQVDLVCTSPPYMTRNDHPQYPFAGYQVTGQGYDDYLRDIARIFAGVRTLMKPDALALVEVANIRKAGVLTPLAFDVARALSSVMTFVGETIICWLAEDPSAHAYGFGMDHSYLLAFR